MNSGESYDLSNFKKIRCFSWIGPHSKEDFDAIRSCFHANAAHMEVLKLDLLGYASCSESRISYWSPSSNDSESRTNFLAMDILGIDMDKAETTQSVLLTALQDLHLEQVPFRPESRAFVSGFNMSKLKRMVLWNCPGTADLLRHLTLRGVQLISFELTCSPERGDDMLTLREVVPSFLRKFSGLQDLFLNLPEFKYEYIMASLSTHLTTLRRVVLHARDIDLDEESPYYGFEQDIGLDCYPNTFDLFTNGICEIIAMQNTPSEVVSQKT